MIYNIADNIKGRTIVSQSIEAYRGYYLRSWYVYRGGWYGEILHPKSSHAFGFTGPHLSQREAAAELRSIADAKVVKCLN